MNDCQNTYVYESPDGGDTIYRRPVGGDHTQRELHSISDRKKSLNKELARNKLWGDIHRASEKDPVLKDMLDKVEVYHGLKNSP